MPHTTFSVIIPAYRQARYLARTLDCVLAQTHPAHEIIVVDDGSPDDTPDICASYARHIRYLRKEPNRGVSAARNTALHAATGEYVQFLDADDYLASDALEMHQAAIHADASGGVYYGSAFFMDADEKQLGEVIDYRMPDQPFHVLLLGNHFPPHTAVVRRTALFEAGLWDVSMTHYEDWDLWLRLAALGHRYVKSEGVVVGYRQHEGSATRNLERMRRGVMAVLAKAERYHRDCAECRRGLANGRWNARRHFLRQVALSLRSRDRASQSTDIAATLVGALRTDPALLGVYPRDAARSLRAALAGR